MRSFARTVLVLAGALALWLVSSDAFAQKVYLNPSDQDNNAVSGGGVESQYALIVANKAKAILDAAGFTTKVDQDFSSAPSNANSWGADVFVSIHSNAGGGHGTETLYKSDGGKKLASAVQNGLLSKLPYQDRGLKYRDNLHVLNNTNMYACLLESVFHDCTAGSGYAGHPPSESAFLRSADGQTRIAQGTAAGVCAYYGKSCDSTTPAKGTLRGVVYIDPDIANRIPGATVKLNTGASVIADGTGSWAFELAPGTYTATATADGYEPNSSTRDVVAGQEVWGSIGLKPTTVTGPEPEPEPAPEPVPEAGPVDSSVGDVVTISDAASEAAAPKNDWNTDDDGGCGCRTPASRTASSSWLLLGAAALLFATRRRFPRT
ncbi:MAG TPA: N-acetylmuramoyl-L-alanine amidase [Polyangiaceae bacterium]|nr:N-acetylmuramoyl-L-alanine amidase [Polyangiaceae bacterium]